MTSRAPQLVLSPGLSALTALGVASALAATALPWRQRPLMLLPAATGLMSARWLRLLTVWLVLERLSPRGGLLATLGGLALIAYGAVRLA